MSIEIKKLNKSFGDFHALKDIDLTVATGSLVALLGPSGCGKTTLLRIIAGLEYADNGQILIHGADETNTPVKERHIGFMFQHYALFRQMNVFDNVAFGLQVAPRKQRLSKSEIHDKVTELLQLVQLPHLAKAFPTQLSGGQRQRIALARALAVKPKLLLLDEPFGALDAKVRKELRQWLRDIHDELKVTSLLVTHDQEEALEISDQIVVMNHGIVEQTGNGSSLYHQPLNPFVTEFLGETTNFSGYVENHTWHYDNFRFDLTAQPDSPTDGSAIAYVRPHHWLLNREQSGLPLLQGEVRHIHDMGPLVRLSIISQKDGQAIEILLSQRMQSEQQYKQGEKLHLTPEKLLVFAA